MEVSDEENDAGVVPDVEMSEIKMGKSFVQELYKEDGTNETPLDVTSAWEAMLAKKRPTSSMAHQAEGSTERLSNKGKTFKDNHKFEKDEMKEDTTSENWSQQGEEGSGEYGTKITSPIPEINKNFHWTSLEFGSNTFGKLGLKTSMARMWNGINILDK